MNPADAPTTELSEDEAEAFIGQEGADGFDGVVLDDLDGEGASCCHPNGVLLLLLLLLLRLLLPDVHYQRPPPARHINLQACKQMRKAAAGMRMESRVHQKTIPWRMTPCRTLRAMQVGSAAAVRHHAPATECVHMYAAQL